MEFTQAPRQNRGLLYLFVSGIFAALRRISRSKMYVAGNARPRLQHYRNNRTRPHGCRRPPVGCDLLCLAGHASLSLLQHVHKGVAWAMLLFVVTGIGIITLMRSSF